MSPHEIRRPFKRPAISDQQKRRELSLLRQQQNRQEAQNKTRFLATTFEHLSTQPESSKPDPVEHDIRDAGRLKGQEARKWFAGQLMLPEWMVDVPHNLHTDWYVSARPAGKRCFVVSSNGTTVSRLRNGSQLHRFPSALPSGAREKGKSWSGQSYCILDCIFHEMDQTYYVLDMLCWAGYSLYECTSEFRFFWLNSKLVESGACEPPSFYHKYRFAMVPVYNCDQSGLQAAYAGPASYVKDGLLFYNKHAHYQAGNTPLALVWKDENCSTYVIDTDSKGQIPSEQPVVLELQEDGKLTSSDDPPVVFGCLDLEFIQKDTHTLLPGPARLHSGDLIRFGVKDGGLNFTDGKLERADLQYLGKSNRARAFADSYSKVMFQYMARHSPLRIEDLLASMSSSSEQENGSLDMEVVG